MAAQRTLRALGTSILGGALLVLSAAETLVLFAMWPLVAPVADGAAPVASWGLPGLGPWSISRETALLLLVVVVSMLGSFVHAATSFATYVGNRRLHPSWVWWYVLRTTIGAALALIVYFAIRGACSRAPHPRTI
jgi:hypothetical protein